MSDWALVRGAARTLHGPCSSVILNIIHAGVREAYGYRCAMSGLMLHNGGGQPEVQAAHIRPVENSGSNSVRNGLALSGTMHWMFDRGLISAADDCETTLVSHDKVLGEVVSR